MTGRSAFLTSIDRGFFGFDSPVRIKTHPRIAPDCLADSVASLVNPQQVLPLPKVAVEAHALRDLEARWTLRSIALLPLPGRSWISCTPKSQPSKKQIADLRTALAYQTQKSFSYCAPNPPSTMMSWPVVNAAPGELSQRTALAISSGVPMRPTGVFVTYVFFISVSPSPKARSNISVWIRPGDTLLTRTPCPANSSAADLVRPMTANLLAA